MNRTALVAAAALAGGAAAAISAQTKALQNRVSITRQSGLRIIESNGIPDHTMGQFPNRGNPNRVAEMQYRFTITTQPKAAEKPTPCRLGIFGFALNGVPFDPGAAEWWNNDRSSGWQYEPLSGAINLGLDENAAHVQPTGAYHYHGIPIGLVRRLGEKGVVQLGWAADGFPIYGPWGYADPMQSGSPLKKLLSSWRIKRLPRNGGPGGTPDGTFIEDYEYIAGSGDLDECNGRFGVTPEFPQGTYYYVLTETWPVVPRFFRGTPDRSFLRGPGGRRPGGAQLPATL